MPATGRLLTRTLLAPLGALALTGTLLPAAPASAAPAAAPVPSVSAPSVSVTAVSVRSAPVQTGHAAPRPRAARPWPGHPGRVLVTHVVRKGDTATGLSVRYHAWTREFVALNGVRLRVGERVRVPVVVAAARRAARAEPRAAAPAKKATKPAKPTKAKATRPPKQAAPRSRGWSRADLSREQVRRLVADTARRLGVPADLALAIAWQESGWQQRRVSSAGALGVMQVMPDTGRWMEMYVGRRLYLRDTHDNVLAGVRTIRVLMDLTHRDNRAIAAYYQGLGAVRERGLYDDTKQYLASVRALERRIARTGSPI